MRGLIKFTLLIFAFCLKISAIDFANIHIGFYDGRSSFPSNSSYKKVNDVEFLSDSYLRIGDSVYSYSTSGDNLFNLFLKNGYGFYLNENRNSLQFYDSSHEKYTVYCESNTARSCSFAASTSYPAPVEFSYFKTYDISYFVTCPADEHFNTDTKECQKCKENESWDPQTNTCFNDCTDRNKNMWGFTDGSCADCSGEKDSDGVKKCYCNFMGSSPLLQSVELIEGNFRFTSCQNGSQFWYKVPGTPDSDNNNTKPDNPNPGGKPNPGGDSGGGGGNPGGDSGGGSGGGNGGGGGGNGGGKEDKPSPNPGTGDNPEGKPNPNPNPGGGSGGSGNGNNKDKDKDGEAKFNKGDFDDGDLDKERSGLYNGIAKHINDNFSKFDGIRDGVDQFIKNVQGKGFETVKTSIKSKCPMKKEIPLPNGGSKDITVDLCEYVSPASEISYYAFYVGFAVGGFLLFLKLLIFSF